MPSLFGTVRGEDRYHLHPPARLQDAQRLHHVRADRWIGYDRAGHALARLEELLAWPTRQGVPNVLLIGPTNNGKSMITGKFRRSLPQLSHADREEIPSPGGMSERELVGVPLTTVST